MEKNKPKRGGAAGPAETIPTTVSGEGDVEEAQLQNVEREIQIIQNEIHRLQSKAEQDAATEPARDAGGHSKGDRKGIDSNHTSTNQHAGKDSKKDKKGKKQKGKDEQGGMAAAKDEEDGKKKTKKTKRQKMDAKKEKESAAQAKRNKKSKSKKEAASTKKEDKKHRKGQKQSPRRQEVSSTHGADPPQQPSQRKDDPSQQPPPDEGSSSVPGSSRFTPFTFAPSNNNPSRSPARRNVTLPLSISTPNPATSKEPIPFPLPSSAPGPASSSPQHHNNNQESESAEASGDHHTSNHPLLKRTNNKRRSGFGLKRSQAARAAAPGSPPSPPSAPPSPDAAGSATRSAPALLLGNKGSGILGRGEGEAVSAGAVIVDEGDADREEGEKSSNKKKQRLKGLKRMGEKLRLINKSGAKTVEGSSPSSKRERDQLRQKWDEEHPQPVAAPSATASMPSVMPRSTRSSVSPRAAGTPSKLKKSHLSNERLDAAAKDKDKEKSGGEDGERQDGDRAGSPRSEQLSAGGEAPPHSAPSGRANNRKKRFSSGFAPGDLLPSLRRAGSSPDGLTALKWRRRSAAVSPEEINMSGVPILRSARVSPKEKGAGGDGETEMVGAYEVKKGNVVTDEEGRRLILLSGGDNQVKTRVQGVTNFPPIFIPASSGEGDDLKDAAAAAAEDRRSSGGSTEDDQQDTSPNFREWQEWNSAAAGSDNNKQPSPKDGKQQHSPKDNKQTTHKSPRSPKGVLKALRGEHDGGGKGKGESEGEVEADDPIKDDRDEEPATNTSTNTNNKDTSTSSASTSTETRSEADGAVTPRGGIESDTESERSDTNSSTIRSHNPQATRGPGYSMWY